MWHHWTKRPLVIRVDWSHHHQSMPTSWWKRNTGRYQALPNYPLKKLQLQTPNCKQSWNNQQSSIKHMGSRIQCRKTCSRTLPCCHGGTKVWEVSLNGYSTRARLWRMLCCRHVWKAPEDGWFHQSRNRCRISGYFQNWGIPKWMVKIMENPIKMDDLGVPLFSETST